VVHISENQARLLELLVSAQKFDTPIHVLEAARTTTNECEVEEAKFELAESRNSKLDDFYKAATMLGIDESQATQIVDLFLNKCESALVDAIQGMNILPSPSTNDTFH